MPLPLNQIIGSIIKEFEKSTLANDLSREYLRESYQSHPILKETLPSRIRVSEASISLPLAFHSITGERPAPQEISVRQIRIVLSDNEEIPDKDELAERIYTSLKKKKQNLLTNKNLVSHINTTARMQIKDFKLSQAAMHHLEALQLSFERLPTKKQETQFVFETEELEKLPSDRIFRMEFKLVMD